MSIRGPLALLAGALLLGACGDITVPDYTSPPLDDLTKNPTVERVKSGAVGLQIASRLNQPGYVLWTAMVGREAYFVDPNEPRYMTRIVQGTPSGANFTGNVYWALPYRNVRNANILVAALERVEMPAADEEAVKGFARTLQALEYLQIVNMRDSIPIYVNSSLDSLATQPPFAARRQALEHVSALLDSAAAQLRAAGASFPFDMASGFTQFGFNTPARFLHFNRGLKARAETYLASPVVRPAYAGRAEVRGDRARYAAALQALGASFLNTAGTVNPLGDRTLLNAGVYQTYGSGSGDQSNGLYDPSGKTVAERGYRTDAELRPDGQRDARYVVKIDSVGVVTSRSGVTSELRFAIYDTRPFYGGGTLSSPIPIIRNEELVLLRGGAVVHGRPPRRAARHRLHPPELGRAAAHGAHAGLHRRRVRHRAPGAAALLADVRGGPPLDRRAPLRPARLAAGHQRLGDPCRRPLAGVLPRSHQRVPASRRRVLRSAWGAAVWLADQPPPRHRFRSRALSRFLPFSRPIR